MESEEWNNGVFTACILKALKDDLSADMNFDGTLTANELQHYVQTHVPEMTGGVQKVSVVAEEDGDAFGVTDNLVGLIDNGKLKIAEKLLHEGISADDGSAPKGCSIFLHALKQHASIDLLKLLKQRGANRPCLCPSFVFSNKDGFEFFEWGMDYLEAPGDDLLAFWGYSPSEISELHAVLPEHRTDTYIEASAYEGWNAEQLRKEGGRLSDAGKNSEAMELIIAAAEADDTIAQRWLGWRYIQGRGVKKDKEEAEMWFNRAARKGDAAAVDALRVNGLNLWSTYAAPKDPYAGWSAERLRKEGGRLSDAGQQTQVLQLIMRAAEAGDSTAQRWLGFRYLNGRGVAADKSSASYWFKRAADQGDSAAAEALRTNGLSNSGAARGSSSSSEPYAGWSAAQLRAEGGRLSDAGKQTEALQLIKRAANAGDSTAQRWLGFRYLNGRGVPKDKNQAKYWLGQAAGQGDSAAAAALKDIR